jgi:hypothetical protein
MAGVAAGRVGRRRGRARAYSATTVRDYARSYSNFLRPEFGPMVADDIGEVEWQMWVDRLSREDVKLLPQPGEADLAERLNDYFDAPPARGRSSTAAVARCAAFSARDRCP